MKSSKSRSITVDQDLTFEGGDAFGIKSPLSASLNVLNGYFHLNAIPRHRGTSNLIARLHPGGPILGAQPVNLIAVSDALQNDLTTSFRSRDFVGYDLLHSPLVVTDLPPGGSVVIRIFRAGVTFPDGTKNLTLSASDFVNDTYILEFLFPIGMSGGYCHHIDIYDRNGTRLGTR